MKCLNCGYEPPERFKGKRVICCLPQPVSNISIKKEPWPLLAERLGRLRKPGEVGLGDTTHRVLSWMGGKQFEWLTKKLGIDCGCSGRQKFLNERFSYASNAIWYPVDEKIQKPTKPNLVITIAIGDKFQELLSISRPLMEAYAAKCNADFVVLENKRRIGGGSKSSE
jgi:hypothetical protein